MKYANIKITKIKVEEVFSGIVSEKSLKRLEKMYPKNKFTWKEKKNIYGEINEKEKINTSHIYKDLRKTMPAPILGMKPRY